MSFGRGFNSDFGPGFRNVIGCFGIETLDRVGEGSKVDERRNQYEPRNESKKSVLYTESGKDYDVVL